MSVVYRTSYLLLHYDPAAATLETEWLDFANSEQLRTSLNEALRLGRQYRVKGWIGNNTLMRTIRPADQEWISSTWFPEFARLGVKRLAVVMAQDALNRMGIDAIMQSANEHTPFATEYFADAMEARAWAASTDSQRAEA